MISSLLNREIGRICRSAVRLLDITVSRAMGCFFGCFRIKDDRSHISHSICRKHTEPVISKNSLSSLFRSEEKAKSWSEDLENQRFESPQIDKNLKDEAKFLKACGTLPETPAEIRKASQKLKHSPSYNKDADSSEFHSWLPNTSILKLQLDRQCDQSPTPIKLSEEWVREPASMEYTPSSCISDVHNTGRISISSTNGSDAGNTITAVKVHANQPDNITSVSPWISGTNAQCRSKSVRFECDFDTSSSKGSSGNINQNSGKYESLVKQSISKPSPNPTPLKFSDDMQTPGTVFPANLKSLENGNARIRSQYVYSISNPVENTSQWKALKDEYGSVQSVELRESLENSSGKDLKVDASLSWQLNPPSSTYDDDNHNLQAATASRKNSYFGRTSGDRPIIGMVAAHWNEDETPQIAPKWWDGNGIPNSTNKYKEDQKVSWHATPFEERLEKALSEESSISRRQNVQQGPMDFNETEDTDTALSGLRHSPRFKSVVSY